MSAFVSEQEEFNSHYYPKEREVKIQIVLPFSQGLVCFLLQGVGTILTTDFHTDF